jgi:hypothetical protein
MEPLDLLKGRKMSVETDMKVSIELTIEEVKENHHSRDLTESNAANDWWPETKDWTTYTVKFTNGASKEFSSLSEIKILD